MGRKFMNLFRRAFGVLREEGVRAFIKKVLLYVFGKSIIRYILSPFIARKFRGAVRNIDNIYDALEFAFSFQAFGVSIKPSQVRYEVAKLLEVVAELKPRVVLEIGTAGGGTLFLFTRVADPEAKIISVDLPGGPFGGGYPAWKIPLYKSFAREKQQIYLIRADPHNYKTLDKVKEILNSKSVDFLFIDGDHSYEGVKKDFEMYSPLVKKGIIAFHDIVPGPLECVGGIPKFWQEIKMQFSYKEIVKNWKQGGYGIGVLYV
jgi:cephalosporin hydroxylase